MNAVYAFEHTNLVASYEELNKEFRFAQKALDRESARTHDLMREIEQFLKGPTVSVNHLRPLIEGLQEQIIKIKGKLLENVSKEKTMADALKTKLTHLKAYDDHELSQEEKDSLHQVRLGRILVDYMLRCGYYDTAEKAAERLGITEVTNVMHFAGAKKVEKALLARRTNECLDWCHENRSKLRRLKSSFELKVRQQDFIELLRSNEKMQAIDYAKKHFGTLDQETFRRLLPTMALLAFRAGTNLVQYNKLWSLERWDELISDFRKENFRLYNIREHSPFSAIFQSGLSALKTTSCIASSNSNMDVDDNCEEMMRKIPQCPVCVPEVRPLAEGLPIGRVSHSKLICAYSGEMLNENNPPFVLPNGMVYGQNSLLAIAEENNGRIICPRTKHQFFLKEAERVFVL
uniref:E3 ubiquitin-protein transferase MAEA n=1 Tax=Trichuris muris TaxID=70415 RepID=A0A5S6QCX6_TRIMR